IAHFFFILALFTASAAQDICPTPEEGCYGDDDCSVFGPGATCNKDSSTDFIGCCKSPSTSTTAAPPTFPTESCLASEVCLASEDCWMFGPGATCYKDSPTDFLGCCSAPFTSTTAPQTCVDLINPVHSAFICSNLRASCTSSSFSPMMRVMCPATCGFC
ncbi:hypothetical protein PENTCL1PPCAC_3944, partial [Pristionchus entomophagus]